MPHSCPTGVRFDTRKPKNYHFSRWVEAVSVARHSLGKRSKKRIPYKNNLTFMVAKPLPACITYQEVLMAAEAGHGYFS